MKLYDHQGLVAIAAGWLTKKHSVVVTELATTGETPDAIGWRGSYSTLVECKTSVGDFRADASKFSRQNAWHGVGQARYFLAPEGVIPMAELPPKWGLLELVECGIQITRKSEHFDDVNTRHEVEILLSTIRRIGQQRPKGVSVRCYTIESKNTATVGIELEEQADALAGKR